MRILVWATVVLAAACTTREPRPIEPVKPAPLPRVPQHEIDAVFADQERAKLEGLRADGFLVYEGPGDEELVEVQPVEPGEGGER